MSVPTKEEKLKDLKKQRGVVKTKLTRTLKQIRSEVQIEENKDDEVINDLMKKASIVTEELEKLNGDLMLLCEGAEYQQAEEYIEECLRDFIDTKKLVNKSLKAQETSVPNTTNHDQNHQSQLRLSSLNMLTAANAIKFSGDPLYYHSFISGYNSAVEGIEDSSIKLKSLLALCEGDALASIQFSLLRDPEEGLKAALETLKTRCGNPPVIAQAWVQKILCYTKLDSFNICRFSDDLENCVAALGSLKCMGELDNQTNIRMIAEKLPRFVQYRWISEGAKIKRNTGKYASLSDLVKFVKAAAEEMTDPILGAGRGASTRSEVGSVNVRKKDSKGKTFYAGGKNGAANSNTKDTSCCACGSTSHPIWRCSVFRGLNVDKRWELVSQNKLCFKCLGDHFAKNCKREMLCNIGGCYSDHNRLLHRSNDSKLEQGQVKEGEQGCSQPSNPIGIEGESRGRNFLNKGQGLALRIVPVMVRQGKKEIKVNALLDDGSEQTYIDSGLAAELGLSGTQSEVCVSLLNGLEKRFASSEIELEISNVSDSKKKYKIRGLTIDQVCGDLKPIDWTRISKDWNHLKDINFPVPANGPVHLLIGVDHVDLHRTLEERVGEVGEPVARKTPLGWTCVGPTTKSQRFVTYHAKQVKTFKCQIVESVDEIVKKFWEVDTMGIKDENVPQTNEEKRAMELVTKSLKHVDGRYEVKIPWTENKDSISDNKVVAESRLHNLEKKLTSDKSLGEEYCKVINSYEEKGYIKKVSKNDKDPEKVWYLPHFAVVKPDRETTKVRIVYDASAKYKGLALNDVILNGPKLQTDLFDVLINFRRNKIALMCDISEMYMQVGIDKDDRSMLRFLWRDLDQTRAPEMYEFQRLAFGLKAAPFISQLIAKENARRYLTELPLAAKTVLQSTYMDDSMESVSDVNSAISLYHQINELWSRAGMEARKWLSNSKEVLHEIPPSHRARQVRLAEGELPPVKALGLTWLSEEDRFIFSRLVASEEKEKWTKRKVLSKLASVFDPLGFVSPVTVKGKILMQEIWESGADWDEQVNPCIAQKFHRWCDDLDCMSNIKVDRCLCPYSDQQMEIHTFVDASSEAYGAITYIKSVSDDEVSIKLAAAKTRVAPLKSTSIPRLELMAAVLGLRLTESITRALGFTIRDVTFWSDSTNVLWWVRGRSRNFKPFVANRVGFIQTKSNPAQWRYIPTKLNPADIASRGATARELYESRLWWNGPEFLMKSRNDWPDNKVEVVLNDNEQKKLTSFLTKINLRLVGFRLNPERFSNWQRLVHVFAYVSRFVTNCKKLPDHRQFGELTVEEVRDAETAVIKCAQEETFSEEVKQLKTQQVVKPQSALSSLMPKLEDGVLRVNGRLSLIEVLPYDTRYPIVLPRKHPVTRLIVKDYHDKGNHVMGTNHVLSLISEKYWIIHGREEVRECEKNCMECKRRKAKSACQVMAPLPSSRGTVSLRAFSKVSVDYAGPFYTIQGRGKARQKRYLCLFVCLGTRAVHCEMAYGLDTDTFLNALFRFINRRGKPSEIMSDNGSNFIGADRELRSLVEVLDKSKLERRMTSQGIKWSFNPPLTPHFGGVHESLIKSAKRAIYAILKQADIRDEELNSAFIGAEGILNSRPLTYVSASEKDPTPLTPNHFLHGSLGGNVAPEEIIDATRFDLRKRWRRVQELVKHFWGRWIREWLPTLHRRNKWKGPNTDLAVGDVVLTIEEDLQRGKWPLGRVVEVYPGPDGHVRVAKVKTSKGDVVRGITKLCPLEVVD